MALNAFGELVLTRAHRIEAVFDFARKQLKSRCGVDAATPFDSVLNGRRLAVLVKLVQQGNMHAVAQKYGITQAAISYSLREMESRLGTLLFDRTPLLMQPTLAGPLLACQFRRVLDELQQIRPKLDSIRG